MKVNTVDISRYCRLKPDFAKTNLLACIRAPRCPPFLVLVLVVALKVFALVLQRGALIVVLVLLRFGVCVLDMGQGALQRMLTPPEVMPFGRSAPPIHWAPAGTSGYLHWRTVGGPRARSPAHAEPDPSHHLCHLDNAGWYEVSRYWHSPLSMT